MEVVKIPFDKSKLALYFIGALVLIIAGILFIIKPFWFIRSDDPAVIKIIGYIFIILFSGVALFIAQKLWNNLPGLVLDDEGITDNAGGSSVGKFFWKDIVEISRKDIMNQPFILLKMKNPLFYLDREKNPLEKQMMELNLKLFNTPVSLTSKGLKIGIDELYTLISTNSKKFS